jgi:hypothetical protein
MPRRIRLSPMPSENHHGLDGWLIGELRQHSRPTRIDGLLLENGSLAQVECRLDATERELAELRARVRRAERRLDGASVHHAHAHTRFVPDGTGYEIVEADGPPPRAGEEVAVGGRSLRVLRVGRSPFPFDRRPCVYLV